MKDRLDNLMDEYIGEKAFILAETVGTIMNEIGMTIEKDLDKEDWLLDKIYEYGEIK